ncbi:MAG TPA: hypothetical protein VH165_11075, partial [Kofleriaceae bacterium]|nr:hypothetical protein [Kofleriaceae bacterium]
MRKLLPLAIVASVASHATALAWIVHANRVLVLPPRGRLIAAVAPARDARTVSRPSPSPSEPLSITLLDEPLARPALPVATLVASAPARTASAAPASVHDDSSAVPPHATSVLDRALDRALAISVAVSSAAPAIPEPSPAAASRPDPRAPTPSPPLTPTPSLSPSPLLAMRRRISPDVPGLSPELLARFVAQSKPLAPPSAVPESSHADQLTGLRMPFRDGGSDTAEQRAQVRHNAADELHPTADGTYRADKQTFTAHVDRDGTVHLKDKLGNLDIQDHLMLAFGIDPYAGAKLAFLDRTRDQRAALGAVRIHELLSHSAELMLQNINHLWAVTPD